MLPLQLIAGVLIGFAFVTTLADVSTRAQRWKRIAGLAAAVVVLSIAWGVMINATTYHDSPTWMVVTAGSVLSILNLAGGILMVAGGMWGLRRGRSGRR